MRTRGLAIVLLLALTALVGAFIWATMRTLDPGDAGSTPDTPTAQVSEMLTEGRLDLRVYTLQNRNTRIEVRLTPDVGTADGLPAPEVSLSMVDMNMGSVDQPVQLVGPGVWQADVRMPMRGRWMVTAGFSEDFARVAFDAP